MAQIFHPSTNTISRLSIFGALFLVIGLLWILAAIDRSSYVTEAGVVREQPVPFSHQHHVGGLGIDCRYCHTSVEESSFAGIPATEICMNCHSQIWAASDMLKPVRDSFKTGEPLRWQRVHNLPDFVYFDHSIHVHKGVGCATCHGPVDRMPLMWQAESLQMEWCLGCHRNPAPALRPREFITSMDWRPPAGQEAALARRLAEEYEISSPEVLTSCSTCHR
ncbi:MAG TPA: cytochrome c3 family protein [Candidatus Eisenbacteria bacterium]|nr:cytochrome c3 family protein [Candidatus Eisenbacteria bacterium]